MLSLAAQGSDRRTLGRYEILERLGEGGMAEVYLARMRGPSGISRRVALKVLRPDLAATAELASMFEDEARLAVLLSHPAIVTVYDVGIEHEAHYLAMEFVEGTDLRKVLERAAKSEPLPRACALFIAQQIASALDHAHCLADDQGRPLEIVHRDVSPANVLVSYRGEVKLADFGIARAADRMRHIRTEAGTLKGKIRYMSPEQARGETLDRRSDLFSLATVLLELITLKAAFAEDSDLKSLRRVQGGIPSRWAELQPKVPPELLPILTRAMAVEPADRYASGAEMAEALGTLLAGRNETSLRAELAEYVESMFGGDHRELKQRLAGYDQRGAGEQALPLARTEIGPATPARTPAPRKRALLPPLVAGVVLLAGVVAVWTLMTWTREPDPIKPVAPVAPVAVEPVAVPAREGFVAISTNVSGARVFLDASPTQASAQPIAAGGMHLRFPVPADREWTLRLESDGYETVRIPLRVNPGQETALPMVMVAKLTPPSATGRPGRKPSPPANAAPAKRSPDPNDPPHEHLIEPF